MKSTFIDLINNMFVERYGDGFITVDGSDEDSIWIYCNRLHVYTIHMRDDKYQVSLGYDDKVSLYTDSISLLGKFVIEIFKLSDAEIISQYKRGSVHIEKLPTILADKVPEVDTSKLTKELFIELFHEVTKNESNSETVENVKFLPMINNLEIRFDIDCGRYGLHRHNKVMINNRGKINVQLCEYLEGGGIESGVTEKILNIIA